MAHRDTIICKRVYEFIQAIKQAAHLFFPPYVYSFLWTFRCPALLFRVLQEWFGKPVTEMVQGLKEKSREQIQRDQERVQRLHKVCYGICRQYIIYYLFACVFIIHVTTRICIVYCMILVIYIYIYIYIYVCSWHRYYVHSAGMMFSSIVAQKIRGNGIPAR